MVKFLINHRGTASTLAFILAFGASMLTGYTIGKVTTADLAPEPASSSPKASAKASRPASRSPSREQARPPAVEAAHEGATVILQTQSNPATESLPAMSEPASTAAAMTVDPITENEVTVPADTQAIDVVDSTAAPATAEESLEPTPGDRAAAEVIGDPRNVSGDDPDMSVSSAGN